MSASDNRVPTVAVLMTCFNRIQHTIRALNAVFHQADQEARQITVFLVDDGSTDGTSAAVSAQFPQVRLIHGSGNLFWNRGMRVAFESAIQQDFDYYLWLNDDTELFPNAFDLMLSTMRAIESKGESAILTGSTMDPDTQQRSYGGFVQSRHYGRVRNHAVIPDATTYKACDTMNGNCTLIPRSVVQVIGNLDATFHHSFGDMDYGFRAKSAGFNVYVAPGFIGTCRDNAASDTWRDGSSTFRKRWRQLQSPKGSPFGEWLVYSKRHLGPLWPLYALSPYLKTLLSGLRHRGSRS